MTPPDDSLPFTDDVAAATAPIYARVKNVIPAIEWPLFAPEIAAIQRLKRQRNAIILAHNHPSLDSSPSEADIRVTRDLVRAGQLLRIEILDHVIIGSTFTSLRSLGYFHL